VPAEECGVDWPEVLPSDALPRRAGVVVSLCWEVGLGFAVGFAAAFAVAFEAATGGPDFRVLRYDMSVGAARCVACAGLP
jgi:hypothetical protein